MDLAGRTCHQRSRICRLDPVVGSEPEGNVCYSPRGMLESLVRADVFLLEVQCRPRLSPRSNLPQAYLRSGGDTTA